MRKQSQPRRPRGVPVDEWRVALVIPSIVQLYAGCAEVIFVDWALAYHEVDRYCQFQAGRP